MIDAISIDRLVDDEIHDDERSNLLRQLDATPDGWKRCALAFLEAQAFRTSARSWAAEITPAPTRSGNDRRRISRLSLLAQFAATVMLSGTLFATGYALGTDRTPNRTSPDVSTNVKLDPAYPPAPTVASVLKAWKSQPAPVPEYVRSHWEREGYQIEQERKVMAVDLEDGRRVVFPVDDVRVQYVGQTTY